MGRQRVLVEVLAEGRATKIGRFGATPGARKGPALVKIKRGRGHHRVKTTKKNRKHASRPNDLSISGQVEQASRDNVGGGGRKTEDGKFR